MHSNPQYHQVWTSVTRDGSIELQQHHFQSSQSGITTFGICNESASTLWKLYILWSWSDWKLSWPQSGQFIEIHKSTVADHICQLPETSAHWAIDEDVCCVHWPTKPASVSHLYCHKPFVDFCFWYSALDAWYWQDILISCRKPEILICISTSPRPVWVVTVGDRRPVDVLTAYLPDKIISVSPFAPLHRIYRLPYK